jgi:hypothetical protein
MLSLRPRAVYLGCVGLILALLLWFYAPTLGDGLFADDYIAVAIMEGKFAAPRKLLDLFNFADGTVEDVRALRRLGSLPWWAPDDYRIAFMRPLSSAAWYFDHTVFGRSYAGYHAHSLFVLFALVVSASFLYRKLFPAGVALLATLVFAVDDSLQFPVLWLSNRGGMYALWLGTLALHAHLKFREQKRPEYAVLSALAVGAGLLFGEWAIPMLAYVAAYELVAATGPLRTRALALLPTFVPTLLFLAARSFFQYGARGSGAYVDPGIDPIRFWLSVTHRVPTFFADMIWNVPSDWWDHGSPWRDYFLSLWLFPPEVWVKLPDWHFFQMLLGAAALAAVAIVYKLCEPQLTRDEQRNIRFLLLGAVGALVPVVGSFPSSRLTIAAFMGLAPLFALLLREVARRLRELRFSKSFGFFGRFASYLAVVFVVLHWQLVSPLQVNVQAQVDHYITSGVWVQGAQIDPRTLAQQRVFLISGSEFTTTFFFSYIWAQAGMPLPLSYYPLTACPCANQVTRSAPNELVLRGMGAIYLASGDENMFQSPGRMWTEGETVKLDGMSVRTEEIIDGHPSRLRVTFEHALEDPSYVFLSAMPMGIMRWTPPPVGHQTLVPRAADPNWLPLERHRDYVRVAPVPEMLHYGSTPAFVNYDPRR